MIHLRNRTVAAGHRNWDMTCSRTGSFSFFLLQVNYAPAAEEVKAAVPSVLRSVEAIRLRRGAGREKD